MNREDEGLRLRALEQLGALGPPLARDALEQGVLEVEPDVRSWQGSLGTVQGHRVVLRLPADLCTRVRSSLPAVDALTAALASAVSDAPGNALAELELTPGQPSGTPYRGRP